MKFICTQCNYILEEEKGLAASGIEAGTKFENIAEDWQCPDCSATKEYFQNCSCVSVAEAETNLVSKT